jgi:hypothetical protein
VRPPRNGLASAATPRPTLCSTTAKSRDFTKILSHSSFHDLAKVGLIILIVRGQHGSSGDSTVDHVAVREEVCAAYPATSSSRGAGMFGDRTHCRSQR